MPIIAKNNDVITVIVIFAVEPERQQELIDNIVEFLGTVVKQQPGFISSSIHKSIDGVRVMNYA
jgi:antibiotic biosynthesis monooxygenase (ABM) superfamily enzyme